ncbi:hypothetical protein BH20ACI2_BH20ACI2_04340 [soil metagenome]
MLSRRKSRTIVVLLTCVAFFSFIVLGHVGKAEASSQRSRSSTLNIVSIFLGQSGYGSPLTKLQFGDIDKVAQRLREEVSASKRTSAVILLTEQADLSAAYYFSDHDERGWFVYNTLTQHAIQSQRPLANFLKRRGVNYRSYWAANMIVADVDEGLLDSLASRPDVARINPNLPQRWIDPSERIKSNVLPDSAMSPDSVEWGVANVNAPAIWAMGYTGQGIVVGDLDTGVRWSHETLISKYRGWDGVTADHNYNWFDAVHSGGGVCGANTNAPCDDNGHGTHTVGTMVGDDGAGNQIGVAPGAKWIGCRNMNQGNGTPATYTECFQFMIAPTDLSGSNPDPARRPHVVNNSWACPASEGCTTGAELETIVNNVQAAGIFVVASAGNSGSGCSSISSPPATYSSSFSVGSIHISNQLSSSSSRGPSLYYDPSLQKPNISAPGVSVRSSTAATNSSYSTFSGTSMAGPHVAGVIALLWSAVPSLSRDIDATKNILQNTANPDVTLITPQTCGGIPSTQIPNNSFGYGRVDALAAVNSTIPPIEIAGRALSPAGQGVKSSKVTLTDSAGTFQTTMTNSLGYFGFDAVEAVGTYVIRINSKRYRFESRTVSSADGDLTNLEFIGLE